MSVADALDEMVQGAYPARGDNRHPHRIGDGAGQGDAEAGFGAVAVHRCQEDLAGPVIGQAAGPFDGVEPGRSAAAMGEDAPFSGPGRLGVDRGDDALAADFLGGLAHEFGPRHRGGVDRHLIGAGQQQFADVLDDSHAAADGQRHEALLGGAAHHVVERIPPLMASGDVEEAQLVGALAIVDPGLLDRVAGISQIDEVDALDHTAVLDVEARDDPHLQHGECPARRRSASFGSMRPSYSARPQITPAMPSLSRAFSAAMSVMPATPPEAMTGSFTCLANAPVAAASTPINAP